MCWIIQITMDMSVYYSSVVDTLLSLSLFDIFFKVDFPVDYFLNHRSVGHATFNFFWASTNKKKHLEFLTVLSLVHCKLNHNCQLIWTAILNCYISRNSIFMIHLAINSYILLNMCSWLIGKEFDLSIQKSLSVQKLWQVLTVLTEILLKYGEFS